MTAKTRWIPLVSGVLGATGAFFWFAYYYLLEFIVFPEGVSEPGYTPPLAAIILITSLGVSSVLGLAGGIVSIVHARVGGVVLLAGAAFGFAASWPYFPNARLDIASAIFFPWWAILLVLGGLYAVSGKRGYGPRTPQT